MHRDAYGPGLVRYGAGDCLAYPPRGIGGELEALCIVELLHGLYKPQIALLYQVQKLHSTAQIPLCYAHHQPEVCLGKALLRGLVPVGDTHRKVHLLLGGEQGHPAYLLQVDLHRVVDGNALAALQLDFPGLNKVVLVQLHLVEIFDDLHPLALQGVIKFLYLLRVKVQLS